LFLGLTVTGTVPIGMALLRSGARVGDLIYVTGTLGDSRAGLQLLSRRTRTAGSRLAASARRLLISRHRRPIARCRFGQVLSAHRLASAAIDVSDGLSGDLRHLCEESRVGARLDLDAIPISPSCRAYARAARCDPAQLALAGGEDYELLFTVAPEHRMQLERQAKTGGCRITRIGTIRQKRDGVRATFPDGSVRPLPVTSYEHFRRKT
jgi:thiamine-monophosphate kinase